jgi:competence protein ComEA
LNGHPGDCGQPFGSVTLDRSTDLWNHGTGILGVRYPGEEGQGDSLSPDTKESRLMIGSLLTKLGMIAATMGLVFWIGWTGPDEIRFEHEATAPMGQPLWPAGPAAATGTPGMPVPTLSRRIPDRSQTPVSPRSPETLDLNRATEQDFVSLPGIGPVLAGRIVEYRKGIGGFHQVEDLREVKGIGKKKFEQIRNLVRVTIPTNPIKQGKKTT